MYDGLSYLRPSVSIPTTPGCSAINSCVNLLQLVVGVCQLDLVPQKKLQLTLRKIQTGLLTFETPSPTWRLGSLDDCLREDRLPLKQPCLFSNA